jgi:hypothetical protein
MLRKLYSWYKDGYISREAIIQLLAHQSDLKELNWAEMAELMEETSLTDGFYGEIDSEEFVLIVAEAYSPEDKQVQSACVESWKSAVASNQIDIWDILTAPFRPGTNIVTLFQEGKVSLSLSFCWGSGGFSVTISNNGLALDYLLGGGMPGPGAGIVIDEHPEIEGVSEVGGSVGMGVEVGAYKEIDEHGNAVGTEYYLGITPKPTFTGGINVPVKEVKWEDLWPF